MEDELYTGMWLLNDQDSGHPFGAVGAFGPLDRAGTVRLNLTISRVSWSVDDENGIVTIDLPEHQARQVAERLLTEAVKLDHLRLLERNRVRDGKATDGD